MKDERRTADDVGSSDGLDELSWAGGEEGSAAVTLKQEVGARQLNRRNKKPNSETRGDLSG